MNKHILNVEKQAKEWNITLTKNDKEYLKGVDIVIINKDLKEYLYENEEAFYELYEINDYVRQFIDRDKVNQSSLDLTYTQLECGIIVVVGGVKENKW